MARRIEIRFEGLGGQGIVLASVVLAEALGVHQGLEAVQTSTYDPETRGRRCGPRWWRGRSR